MEPFVRHRGIVVPLDRANVDTDQIIPKQFLKRITRSGYEDVLFYDWRYLADGKTPDPNFVLNLPRYQGATILLARDNFGCGSSREHAPWALHDYGFRAILAPSFADIFYNNCFNNGLLPVALPAATIDTFFERVAANQGFTIDVDLAEQRLDPSTGDSISFEIDPFLKERLLNGWDQVALTLQHEAAITEYEARLGDDPSSR